MAVRRQVLAGMTAIALASAGAMHTVGAQPADPAGRVTRLRGTAVLVRGGEASGLAVGVEVQVADRVVTHAASRVEVTLSDGTLVVLGPGTDVAVAAFAADDIGGRSNGTLSMLSGILRALVSPSGMGGGFSVEGRLAVASVRSTELVVEVVENRMSVLSVEGEVDVRAGGAQAVLLAGDGVDVEGGGPLPEPSQWGATRVADALARTRID